MTMSSRTHRQRELGDQRDAHAGRDQALDGLVVVALEAPRSARSRPRGSCARRDARTGSSARSAPRLRRRGPPGGCSCLVGERVLARERQVHRVLEQLHARHVRRQRASRRRTRTAARGRARRRAGAARSPRARPRRASARPRGRRRGRWRSRAASASRPRSGRTPSAAARRAGPAIAASAASAASSRARIPSACPTSVWPAAVRRDAARVALEQRHPGFGLERRDLLGDRRLRVGQRLGGGRERAAVGDLPQDPQTGDI